MNDETKDTITLKPSAHQKFTTSNPFTPQLINITSRALITNINNPSVKTVIGSVIIVIIGLINILITPSIIATTSAVQKSSIRTPSDNRYDATNIESVVTNKLRSKFIFLSYLQDNLIVNQLQ